MNRYVFTAESVKTLARLSKLLYDTFSTANKQLVENPTRTMQSDFFLDYVLTPEKYYYVMDVDSQAEIHKLLRGSKTIYTIHLVNMETELPHCDYLPKDTPLYNECYGNFSDIDAAISVYKSIIARHFNKVSANEYTDIQKKVHSQRNELKELEK